MKIRGQTIKTIRKKVLPLSESLEYCKCKRLCVKNCLCKLNSKSCIDLCLCDSKKCKNKFK